MLHILLHNTTRFGQIKHSGGMRPGPMLNQAHEIELQKRIVRIIEIKQGHKFVSLKEHI